MGSVYPVNVLLVILDLDDHFRSSNDCEWAEPFIFLLFGDFGDWPMKCDLISWIEWTRSMCFVQSILQLKICFLVCDLGERVKQLQPLSDDFAIQGGRSRANVGIVDGFGKVETRTATSDKCVWRLTGALILVTVHVCSRVRHAVDPSHPALMLKHENHRLEAAMLSFEISCGLRSVSSMELGDHSQLAVKLFHRCRDKSRASIARDYLGNALMPENHFFYYTSRCVDRPFTRDRLGDKILREAVEYCAAEALAVDFVEDGEVNVDDVKWPITTLAVTDIRV